MSAKPDISPRPRRHMTEAELRMIASLAHVPKIKSCDRRLTWQLYRLTLAAGAPTITHGQARMARLLVRKYHAQVAPVVVALAR